MPSRSVWSYLLVPGIGGFPMICMVSTGGFLIPSSCRMAFSSRVVASRREIGIRKWC